MQIGDILREAREEQGLSLDDIQETTKIQKRYLVAIEQDAFHALPGRFYARAFIKEYAQAVGLDPTVILEDFDESTIEEEKEETVQYTRFDRSKRTEEKNSSILSFLPTVIVVILVIGIIFVAYTLLQKSSTNDGDVETPQENDEIIREKNDSQQPNSDEADENEGAEDEEDEAPDEEEDETDTNRFEVEEVGEENSPLSTLTYYYSGDEIILALEPTGDTYVQILNGNEQVLFEESLTEGTEVEDIDLTGEERVYLNIGNAPGLTVTLNGDELEYPVDANERVHQKIWINLETEE